MDDDRRREKEREEMCASIMRSINATGCGPLSNVEQALVGILTTFMQNHVELHRKVCELERRIKH